MYQLLVSAMFALSSMMNVHDVNVYNMSEQIKSDTGDEYVIDVVNEDYGTLHPAGDYENIYIVDKDCLIDLIIAGGY